MGAVVKFENMEVGAKGGGKHWTIEEVKARKKASEKMLRKKKVRLRMPDRLGEKEQEIWKKTMKEMSGFEILDNVDAEQLAIYCETVAKRNEAMEAIKKDGIILNGKEHPCIKMEQAYSRLILQYAEKLGLTPNGRARLAKKEAGTGKGIDKNGDLFD